MTRNSRWVAPLALCLTAVATAQEVQEKETESAELRTNVRDAKALEILQKVDTTIKKVKSVQYTATREGTGFLAARLAKSEGNVIITADSPQGSHKYRIEVRAQMPGSEEALKFTVGSDGTLFYLIDPIKKVVYADIDPAVAGNRGRLARSLVMREFLHPTPFTDELNADVVELAGIKKVGDQECYVVRVVYRGGQGESIWYFSKKDYLPRRREVIRTNRATHESARDIHTLSNLVVAPTFYDSPYKLVSPNGYKKTDDFAPDIPLPQTR